MSARSCLRTVRHTLRLGSERAAGLLLNSSTPPTDNVNSRLVAIPKVGLSKAIDSSTPTSWEDLIVDDQSVVGPTRVGNSDQSHLAPLERSLVSVRATHLVDVV